MIEIKRTDKIRNEHIRKQTKLVDIKKTIKRNKWRGAGHVERQQDSRWTKFTTEWQVMDGKKNPEDELRDGEMKFNYSRKIKGTLRRKSKVGKYGRDFRPTVDADGC